MTLVVCEHTDSLAGADSFPRFVPPHIIGTMTPGQPSEFRGFDAGVDPAPMRGLCC